MSHPRQTNDRDRSGIGHWADDRQGRSAGSGLTELGLPVTSPHCWLSLAKWVAQKLHLARRLAWRSNARPRCSRHRAGGEKDHPRDLLLKFQLLIPSLLQRHTFKRSGSWIPPRVRETRSSTGFWHCSPLQKDALRDPHPPTDDPPLPARVLNGWNRPEVLPCSRSKQEEDPQQHNLHYQKWRFRLCRCRDLQGRDLLERLYDAHEGVQV
jgi:hypothetical protein